MVCKKYQPFPTIMQPFPHSPAHFPDGSTWGGSSSHEPTSRNYSHRKGRLNFRLPENSSSFFDVVGYRPAGSPQVYLRSSAFLGRLAPTVAVRWCLSVLERLRWGGMAAMMVLCFSIFRSSGWQKDLVDCAGDGGGGDGCLQTALNGKSAHANDRRRPSKAHENWILFY